MAIHDAQVAHAWSRYPSCVTDAWLWAKKHKKTSRYLKLNNRKPIFVFAMQIIWNIYNHKYWNVCLLQITLCLNNFENFETSVVHTHWNKLRYFECWNYHHRLAKPSQVMKLSWASHYNIKYLYCFWCKIIQQHHMGGATSIVAYQCWLQS